MSVQGRRWGRLGVPGLWGLALLAVSGGAACEAGPPEAAERRLAEIRQEGEALSRAADELEERMLADQANLLLWQELARRHRRVSAVVTRTQMEHFSSMVMLLERQEAKARKLRRRQLAEAGFEEGRGWRRQYLSRAEAPGASPGASRARN